MADDLVELAHMIPRPLAYVPGGGGSRGAVQLALAALAGIGTRSGLPDPGLYGRPPLAILNPEIEALRQIRPIPAR